MSMMMGDRHMALVGESSQGDSHMARKPLDSECSDTGVDHDDVDGVSSVVFRHDDIDDAATGFTSFNPQMHVIGDIARCERCTIMELLAMAVDFTNIKGAIKIFGKDKEANMLHPISVNARNDVVDVVFNGEVVVMESNREESFRHSSHICL
ncbi:hypothetical protein AMTR_s00026p00144080 [Amborella trichopoda]|uniref:Uncharacterized protein n=1 Tax=Amborella trichopoda TaxID=13333 RepID=W1PQQ8_AMBTC|nr:hypothetical protein AMTR_s00026p00144080 [Amborella trichopoda]